MGGHSGEWQRLGDGKLLTEDPKIGLGHIVSIQLYNTVYWTLILLMAVTVWAAFQDFGPFNLFVALAIATAKAGIVTLIFMHLHYEGKTTWGIVIYPLFIFILILAGTLGDASVKKDPSPMRDTQIASK